MRTLPLLLVLVCFAARGAPATAPASFEADHARLIAQNPPGLIYRVRLKDDRACFYPGEAVPIVLSFASDIPDRYQLDGATYDRGGRLAEDAYHLDPASGAVDPQAGFPSFSMGGIRVMPMLGPKPFEVEFDLNEWLRFVRPGHCRLFVESSRLAADMERNDAGRVPQGYAPLTSNVLEFDIRPPDDAWAAEQVRVAEGALAAPDDAAAAGAHRRALRVLRFLGTAEAAEALLKRYGQDHDGEYEIVKGLQTSPHRAAVIAGLKRALAEPDRAVPLGAMGLLDELEMALRHPDGPPPYPADGGEAAQAAWQAASRRWNEERATVGLEHARLLAAALPGKSPAARAVSAETLLESCRAPITGQRDEQARLREAARDELVPLFGRLPAELQVRLLRYYWNHINVPQMAPALARIVAEQPADLNNAYQASDRHAAALRRWYELAPDDATPTLVREIAVPPPWLHPQHLGALMILPSETLPYLDEPLTANLENGGRVIAARLLARYASDAVAGRVERFYDASTDAEVGVPLLAYLLRAKPQTGVARSMELFVPRPKGPRYAPDAIEGVAAIYTSPALQAVAIAHLDDDDPAVATHCARVLGSHGFASAEPFLWERLSKLHGEWKGRAAEMRAAEHASAAQLEQALAEAIAKGAAWSADRSKLARLAGLCLSPDVARACGPQNLPADGTIPLSVWMDEDLNPHASLGQYEFPTVEAMMDKFGQYPEGTTFVLTWNVADPERLAALSRTVRQRLDALGMRWRNAVVTRDP